MKAREIMEKEVITIKKESTIEEIAAILSENNISGVPVVDEDKRVIGMVTQKDLLYKDVEPHFPPVVELLGGLIFLQGARNYNKELKKLVATTAEQIMTKKVISVSSDQDVGTIAELMVKNNINRIPVVDHGVLVGIISRADMIKYIAKS